MSDQAAELRRLVFGVARPADAARAAPRMLVVSGGKPGVGATTVAVNLAAALARDAQRVVLIDADLHHAEVAAHCDLAATLNIGDVFAGRKSIHEALQCGPAGMQILAGNASPETRAAASPRSLQRLRRQLRSLERYADWVLIDAGHQPADLMSDLWSLAERVLLVSSPDAAAVMDTYALVKTLLTRQALAQPLALIVNQVAGAASAADVFRRIDQSCRRFLGMSLELAGFVPLDPNIAASVPAAEASRLAASAGIIADAISRLAHKLTATPRLLGSGQRMAA
jgi:flagellar biosynthesis protein FlhG